MPIMACWKLFRSSRPDFIETRDGSVPIGVLIPVPLFRSSRPDFIETRKTPTSWDQCILIVPVFQAGLH